MKPEIRLLTLATLACLWLTLAESACAFYDPAVQRWINRDPIEEKGGANLHAFVRNNCIENTDRFGHDDPGCTMPSWLSLLLGAQQWNTDCYLRCCAIHDNCFFQYPAFGGDGPCTQGSWLSILNPASYCGGCNRKVFCCFKRCFLGEDTASGAMWFCPNGPHRGTFYFNWDSIPADCWESGVKPASPSI